MATSGTVAQTVLDTAVVLEHACRRCGVAAAAQTPETAEIGRQNLYLLLLNLANRGVNLWCVERVFVGLEEGRVTYPLPSGTLRLFNVIYSRVEQAHGADTVAADSFTTELTSPTKVSRVGFRLTSDVTAAFAVEISSDGVSWTAVKTLPSADWVAGEWYWYDLDPAPTATWWRLSSVTPFVAEDFYLSASLADVPMTQFNRDEYAQQVNKTYQQRPCTNFYFEKTVTPTITVWPAPTNDFDHLSVWRHRFVQDVGSLTDQIEVPQQWMEAVIWMLAARLVYELPGIDPGRRTEVIQASERFLMDAEMNETDNAPVYIVPGVGVYTR